MDCRVVSISRALAAGGEEIGRAVADELRFRYVNDEIVAWAADRAGVSLQTMEKVEHTPPLIERILQYMGKVPIEVGQGYVPPPAQATVSYETLIEAVVRETAKAGSVVIVAHGASIPLAGMPGLLRALVTASPEVRAGRLATAAKLDDRKARKAIEDSDRERGEFLQRFYGVRQELPNHYDIVVNTDVLTPATAARLIVTAAKSG